MLKVTTEDIISAIKSKAQDIHEICTDKSCEICSTITPFMENEQLKDIITFELMSVDLGIVNPFVSCCTLIGNGILIGLKIAESKKIEEMLGLVK